VLIDAPVAPQGLQESIVAASVVSSSLESPIVASSTANLPLKGARLQEPTAASSAITPPSERVNPQEPTIASPAINVPPPKGTRPQEPITTSSAVATPPGQVCFITRSFFPFSVLLYSHASLQGLNLSELLAFDPASVASAILEANDPQLDSTRVTG
jgi:hypothetical protein